MVLKVLQFGIFDYFPYLFQHFKGVQSLFDLCTVFSVAFCNVQSIPFGILTQTPPAPWPGLNEVNKHGAALLYDATKSTVKLGWWLYG